MNLNPVTEVIACLCAIDTDKQYGQGVVVAFIACCRWLEGDRFDQALDRLLTLAGPGFNPAFLPEAWKRFVAFSGEKQRYVYVPFSFSTETKQ